MTDHTPNYNWPIPDEFSDPYYVAFKAMMDGVDADLKTVDNAGWKYLHLPTHEPPITLTAVDSHTHYYLRGDTDFTLPPAVPGLIFRFSGAPDIYISGTDHIDFLGYPYATRLRGAVNDSDPYSEITLLCVTAGMWFLGEPSGWWDVYSGSPPHHSYSHIFDSALACDPSNAGRVIQYTALGVMASSNKDVVDIGDADRIWHQDIEEPADTIADNNKIMLFRRHENLLKWSEDISQSTWTKSNATISGTDGMVASAVSATHGVKYYINNNTLGKWTIKFRAKKGDKNWIHIWLITASGVYGTQAFDLANGVLGPSTGAVVLAASIAPSASHAGWFDVSLQYTVAVVSGIYPLLSIYSAPAGTSNTFTGDAVTINTYITALQASVSTFNDNLPYTKTTTVPVSGYQAVDLVHRDREVIDDEIQAPIIRNVTTSAGKLDWNYADHCVDVAGSTLITTNAHKIHYAYQIAHKYKCDGHAHLHIHWLQSQAAIPNWWGRWRFVQHGHPAGSWTEFKYDDHKVAYSSGTKILVVSAGAYIDFTTAAGGKLSMSDFIDVEITRDSNNASGLFSGADPVSGAVGLKGADPHMVIDAPGSTLEWFK
jgi:hypothetical protein